MRDLKEQIEDPRTITDLIDDLRSVDDSPPPDEALRWLAQACMLCNEAADELEQEKKNNDFLMDSLLHISETIDNDPYRVLSKIDVGEHIEKKNGLNYLSWAWAWDTIMRLYPDTETAINRPESGLPYWTDGKTCWVDVSVTVHWNSHARTRGEVFPIMDHRNRSIPLENVTSFDVNTALQRAWTKCIARHGLGFYIYAGQDLPNEVIEEQKKPATEEQIEKVRGLYTEEEIGKMLKRMKLKDLTQINKSQAETMIDKRDRSLIEDQTPTF